MTFALRVESPMLSRVAVIAGACLLSALAAKAEELGPEQARAFVVGKLFSYTCFDGTAGMGRIFADGSVVGTIRPGVAARCGSRTCRRARCASKARRCARICRA
jgi:hypothetical protein